MPRTYGKSKGKAKQTRLSFVPEFTNSQDEEANRNANVRYAHPSLSTLRSPRKASEKSSTPTPFVNLEPSPEEASQKRSRRKGKKASQMSASQNATPPPPATQDSDSDLEIVKSARKNTRARNTKRKRVDSSEPEDPHISDESDADEVVSRPRRKLRRGGAPQPIVVDDDSSEDQEIRAGASNSPDIPHTPRRDSAQDRIDLDEDLEDLQDSVVKTSRTRGSVANSAKAQRQRHLEVLRRRRAGKTDDDDGEDRLSPQPEASGSEQSEDEGEAEAPVRQPQFRSWANDSESSDVESTIGANEDLDRYEDDFVLDDEDDKLGAPSGLEDMPIEFSRHSYKQLKDYFQDAVEWMVQNQLNPAFPRSDPLYRVAFEKLEAEVRGRTGSQYISSVWNTDFRRALLARPQMETTTYPTDFNHPCDACNRTGHPASFDVKFTGKAYSLETLEALADADSDEEQSESEENDNQERDREGYTLPDEDTHFYLGRHCMKNAEMAHTLTHWRFHLNEWVVEHLRITGYMSDKKILKRSHYSQKKKNKHAGKAVKKMIDSGEVKKLWRDFHINLRTARESNV
ncbi:uncharacterized protein APUU_50650S [Aspergillus puulaauensis]|uniref:DUF4211 domain-containing protein n=1 Tax=Aspergillus puulaauensis TaxID=1220207 RepID=A0A7R7XR77_9EURO|nr:uncharacterized protein APUU_50650S [Aspergillus puulaauensis]BCS25939.1 hypothetical protein APUU_50650S [Aspergillus puulaauensis]